MIGIMSPTTPLICRNCHAALQVSPGEQFVTCTYCGTQNMLTGGPAAPAEHAVAPGSYPGFPIGPAELTELAKLTGEWKGEGFDVVNLHGNFGTYSDSYGSLPCRVELRATDVGQFTATWTERDRRRYGTMVLRLSNDGATLHGTWSAAPDCQIRPGAPVDSPLTWSLVRRAGPQLVELAGEWFGKGFNCVNLHGAFGTYTDTYGSQPGRFELRAAGPMQYAGTWGEPDGRRHGTLSLTMSNDGGVLRGTHSADSNCEISPGRPQSEPVVLTRLRWALKA